MDVPSFKADLALAGIGIPEGLAPALHVGRVYLKLTLPDNATTAQSLTNAAIRSGVLNTLLSITGQTDNPPKVAAIIHRMGFAITANGEVPSVNDGYARAAYLYHQAPGREPFVADMADHLTSLAATIGGVAAAPIATQRKMQTYPLNGRGLVVDFEKDTFEVRFVEATDSAATVYATVAFDGVWWINRDFNRADWIASDGYQNRGIGPISRIVHGIAEASARHRYKWGKGSEALVLDAEADRSGKLGFRKVRDVIAGR
jgi:hypothetical protein